MKKFMFNVKELVTVLEITAEEAECLISGDVTIEKVEVEKLASYKGLSHDEVCEIFSIIF